MQNAFCVHFGNKNWHYINYFDDSNHDHVSFGE